MRRLVYHVSVTQDGFIAGPDGEFDFFIMNDDFAETLNARFPETVPTDLREAVGITGENKVFDTVLMGRGTYEAGLAHGVVSPHRHLEQYVFSTTLDELPGPEVELVAGDPVAKVRELKAEDGMDIWLCGGGALSAIHAVDGRARERIPGYRNYHDVRSITPPPWSERPKLWERALELASGDPPQGRR